MTHSNEGLRPKLAVLAGPKLTNLLCWATMVADIFKSFIPPFKRTLATPMLQQQDLMNLRVIYFTYAVIKWSRVFKYYFFIVFNSYVSSHKYVCVLTCCICNFIANQITSSFCCFEVSLFLEFINMRFILFYISIEFSMLLQRFLVISFRYTKNI